MTAFIWNQFYCVFALLALTTLGVVFIGKRLVYFADKLAVGLGISGGLVGFILVAAVTSVPEMVSTFVAAADNHAALAAGNIYGSNSANIAFLAMIFLITRSKLGHLSGESLAGILGSLLILAAVTIPYFMMVRGGFSFGEIPMALFIFLIYLLLMRLNHSLVSKGEPRSIEKGRGGLRGFALYSLLIVACSWALVVFCERMAQLPFPGLGKPLGAQFIGTLILAVSTSVPEIVTTYAMVRKGYTDMAYGNIFGSNVFNLMVFCLAPFFSSGTFWLDIPLTLLYTAFAVLVLSVIMAITTLITSEKVQKSALISIVVLWIASLVMVF